MEMLPKPRQLRICLILLVARLAYDIIYNSVYFLLPMIAQSGTAGQTATIYTLAMISAWSFLGFMIYKISQGRSWPRPIWSLFLILSCFVILKDLLPGQKYPAIYVIQHVTDLVVHAVILILLWHPATTRWFREMQMARIEATKSTPIDTSAEP
jgi:hypothetical protein